MEEGEETREVGELDKEQVGLLIVFENDRLTIVFCFVKRSFSKTIVSFSQKNDRFWKRPIRFALLENE